MISAILALAMAATQAPTPAPLFDAFKAACYDVRTFDGVATAAAAAGWTPTAEAAADPRIASIISKGREAVAKEEPEAKSSGQVFRHKIEGRDIWLVTSRVVMKGGIWANGCRAYDLDAPAPTTEAVSRWVGKDPTGVQGSGTATKLLWEPWKDGVTLEITYVPRDHALGKSYGIQGLILVSQAIGGF